MRSASGLPPRADTFARYRTKAAITVGKREKQRVALGQMERGAPLDSDGGEQQQGELESFKATSSFAAAFERGPASSKRVRVEIQGDEDGAQEALESDGETPFSCLLTALDGSTNGFCRCNECQKAAKRDGGTGRGDQAQSRLSKKRRDSGGFRAPSRPSKASG